MSEGIMLTQDTIVLLLIPVLFALLAAWLDRRVMQILRNEALPKDILEERFAHVYAAQRELRAELDRMSVKIDAMLAAGRNSPKTIDKLQSTVLALEQAVRSFSKLS